jgi:hypothetical protein
MIKQMHYFNEAAYLQMHLGPHKFAGKDECELLTVTLVTIENGESCANKTQYFWPSDKFNAEACMRDRIILNGSPSLTYPGISMSALPADSRRVMRAKELLELFLLEEVEFPDHSVGKLLQQLSQFDLNSTVVVRDPELKVMARKIVDFRKTQFCDGSRSEPAVILSLEETK